MIVVWTDEALGERIELYNFLEEQNIYAAIRLDEKIDEAEALIRTQPYMGVERQDRHARCLIISHFDVNIFYHVDEERAAIVILKVMHQKQYLNPAFKFGE